MDHPPGSLGRRMPCDLALVAWAPTLAFREPVSIAVIGALMIVLLASGWLKG